MTVALSNEDLTFFVDHSLPPTQRQGYLGVGALQNISYLSQCPHAYAIIVDISVETLEFLQHVFHQILYFEKQQDCLAWWEEQEDPLFVQYRQWIGSQGDWLTTPTLYDRVRDLVMSGDIDLIHGDLAHVETHELITKNVRSHEGELSTIYLSNVFSLYHQLQGRDFNYMTAKGLFDRELFTADARCHLTLEFMPDAWKKDLYHYTIVSLQHFKEILAVCDSIDEFLALFLAHAISTQQKACSQFVGVYNMSAVPAIGMTSKEVEKLIKNSDDWLVWQNFKDHFLMKEK